MAVSRDFVQPIDYAYRTVWRERQYLLRLAAVPLLIKIVCLQTIMALGWQDHFLRQSLVMMPSYLADGWMLAQFTRLLLLDQRWPFRPSGDAEADKAILFDRARGIVSGMLVFALGRYILGGFTHFVYGASQVTVSTPGEATTGGAMVALVFLIATFWAFRFLWFYVPAAVNYSLMRFLKDLGGLAASFYMMLIWLGCFMPIFMLLGLGGIMFLSPLAQSDSNLASGVARSLAAILRSVMDTATAFIITAGMVAWIKQSLARVSAA